MAAYNIATLYNLIILRAVAISSCIDSKMGKMGESKNTVDLSQSKLGGKKALVM